MYRDSLDLLERIRADLLDVVNFDSQSLFNVMPIANGLQRQMAGLSAAGAPETVVAWSALSGILAQYLRFLHSLLPKDLDGARQWVGLDDPAAVLRSNEYLALSRAVQFAERELTLASAGRTSDLFQRFGPS